MLQTNQSGLDHSIMHGGQVLKMELMYQNLGHQKMIDLDLHHLIDQGLHHPIDQALRRLIGQALHHPIDLGLHRLIDQNLLNRLGLSQMLFKNLKA